MLTQIQIENQETYQRYLNEFFEEEVSFEQYINYVLGQINDGNCKVKDVAYFPDTQEFLIVYVSKI